MEKQIDRYLVVAVDTAHARFFSLVDSDTPEIESGPDLVETGAMIQPENEMHDEAVFTTTKTGANTSPGNGKMHSYDDHRSRHNKEFARRFSGDIAAQVKRQVHNRNTRDIILVAQASMLGMLRPRIEEFLGPQQNLHSVGKEVGRLSPRQIHELLADENLLPPRRSAGDQMGARRRHA